MSLQNVNNLDASGAQINNVGRNQINIHNAFAGAKRFSNVLKFQRKVTLNSQLLQIFTSYLLLSMTLHIPVGALCPRASKALAMMSLERLCDASREATIPSVGSVVRLGLESRRYHRPSLSATTTKAGSSRVSSFFEGRGTEALSPALFLHWLISCPFLHRPPNR